VASPTGAAGVHCQPITDLMAENWQSAGSVYSLVTKSLAVSECMRLESRHRNNFWLSSAIFLIPSPRVDHRPRFLKYVTTALFHIPPYYFFVVFHELCRLAYSDSEWTLKLLLEILIRLCRGISPSQGSYLRYALHRIWQLLAEIYNRVAFGVNYH
jgi:hypothetical protein